jgi:hypothetical protein
MVRRLLSFVLLAVMIVGAIVTYDMKRRAEGAANQVARLQAEIAREKDQMAALRAEFSRLTQPGRLQAVIEQHADYFRLEPFSPDRIATIGEIPLRPVGGDDAVRDLLARMAASESGEFE